MSTNDRELEALRRVVAGIEALIEPWRTRDAISGDISETRKVHVKARDIRAVLDAAEKELKPQSHADACGCYWCGKYRRGMAILRVLEAAR